ncbi:MAG: hypothetical protein M3Y39_19585 [Chloroflexota bacterium]|nr:hypothetical protein [Chloroflexota bacterium]
MIRDFKWLFGFVASTLLLLWTIALLFVLSNYLPMGPALGLLYLTIGTFILMALLMLIFVFFRETRPISFGLAIPLFVLQIGLLILTYVSFIRAYGPLVALLVNLPGCSALLVVAIAYLIRDRHSGERLSIID